MVSDCGNEVLLNKMVHDLYCRIKAVGGEILPAFRMPEHESEGSKAKAKLNTQLAIYTIAEQGGGSASSIPAGNPAKKLSASEKECDVPNLLQPPKTQTTENRQQLPNK